MKKLAQKQTENLMDKQTAIQITDRQNRLTDRPTDIQIYMYVHIMYIQIDRHIERQKDKTTDRQTERQTERKINRSAEILTDWCKDNMDKTLIVAKSRLDNSDYAKDQVKVKINVEVNIKLDIKVKVNFLVQNTKVVKRKILQTYSYLKQLTKYQYKCYIQDFV